MRQLLSSLVIFTFLLASCGSDGSEGSSGDTDSTQANALLSPDTMANQVGMKSMGDCDTSDECFKAPKCEEASCQDMVVNCHSMTETEFNEMTLAYHDPIVKCGEYKVSDILALIDGLDCTNGDHIAWDDATGSIVLSKATATTKPKKGKYSIAFLKGVIRQSHPSNTDKFEFFRAKRDTEETLCLRLNKGGTSVFWSDLTEAYP